MMGCLVLLLGKVLSAPCDFTASGTAYIKFSNGGADAHIGIKSGDKCDLVLNEVGYYNSLWEKRTKVLALGGVGAIGNDCFHNLRDLEKIYLGENVTGVIGANAFYGCTSLESFALGLPESDEKPACCFVDVTGALYVNGTTTPTTWVFQAYPAAKDPGTEGKVYAIGVSLSGASVVGIAEGAFGYAKYVRNVTIPRAVAYAKEGSFSHMASLVEVRWAAEGATGKLPNDAATTFLQITENFVISAYGTSGPEISYALVYFKGTTTATEVTIPAVGYVCSGAFVSCTWLTKISLTGVSIAIKEGAIVGCTGLTTFVVTATTKVMVSAGLLLSCQEGSTCADDGPKTDDNWIVIAALNPQTAITVPDAGVVRIGASAFSGCDKVPAITVGKEVAAIAEGAFVGATALTEIAAHTDNTAYSSGDTDKILYNKAGTEVVAVPASIASAVTLPDSVSVVAPFAFAGYKKDKVTLSATSAIYVGHNAFTGSAVKTIITKCPMALERDALNNGTSLEQIHFDIDFSENLISCEEIGDLNVIFSAKSEGWLCSLPVFSATAGTGAITTARSFDLLDVPNGGKITSPTGRQSTIKGDLPNGYTISVIGVKLEADVRLGIGSGIRPIGTLNLDGKNINYTVEYSYNHPENGPIDLSSGSLQAASKQIHIKVGNTVARFDSKELASLKVSRLITGSSAAATGTEITGTFADVAACNEAVSKVIVLSQPDSDFGTDVDFSLECSEQSSVASVGLNAKAYDIILVGTKRTPAAPDGGKTPTSQPGGGGNGGGDDDKGLSGGAVAGIVIGVAVVVGLASALIVYFVMSRKQRVNEEKEGST